MTTPKTPTPISTSRNNPVEVVLGIDPGLADTGWAVIVQPEGGGVPLLRDAGIVKTSAGSPLPSRLAAIYARVTEIIERHRPRRVAIEELFFLKAAKSVSAVSQARGVIILAASHAGSDVFEYNPRQVKSTLTGNGKAPKPQMQKMVQHLLHLAHPPHPDDVADAMAIALCHLRFERLNRMIAAGGGRPGGGPPLVPGPEAPALVAPEALSRDRRSPKHLGGGG